VFLFAVVVCLVAAAQGAAVKGAKDQSTRELVNLLERLLQRVSKKEENSTGVVVETDPFEEVYNYLQENEADILSKPVYKVPEERLNTLLSNVVDILGKHVDEDLGSVVSIRFIVAYFEHVLYDGTEKIWQIADEISRQITELQEMSDVASMNRKRVARSLESNKMKARENALRALSAKNMKLTKKYFEDQAPKVDLRSLDDDAEGDDFSGEDFSGYEYCQFAAVWEHIAGPAYYAAWAIRNTTSSFDYYYWGNIYYELEYLAEDEAILQAPVEEAIWAFASQIGGVLFTPPAEFPDDKVWERIVPLMYGIVEAMENFDGTDVPEVEALSEDKAAIFAQIYLAVGPLIQESAKPLRTLLDAVLAGDFEGIEGAIVDYIGKVFGRQLYILSNLSKIIREQLPKKADALATIVQGITAGKEDDVFTALFTKIAEDGLRDGARIEDLIWWFGHILDHVALVVEPTSGQQPVLPQAGRDRPQASGNRKRFLKLMNKF